MYNVLAIAPIVPNLPALSVLDEIARIADVQNVSLTQLTGPVTKDRILDRLGRAHYDAVLWTGHGAPGHLLLSDGDRVDPRWLATQLCRRSINLVVLAACWSGVRQDVPGFVASFADVLPASGINNIVMMIEVADKAAIEYDVALFQSLAAGERLRKAHEVGLEAISRFQGMVQAPMLIPADGEISASISTLKQKVDQIDDQLLMQHPEQARKLISEMTQTLQDLDEKIADTYQLATHTAERVAQLEMQVNPPMSVMVWRALAGLVIFLGLALFFVKDTRDVLFTPYPWFGVGAEVVIMLWAACLWWLGQVTQKNRLQRRTEKSSR